MPALNRISPLIALPLLLAPFAVQAGTMPSYNITVIGPAGSTATALNDAGQVAGNYQSNGAYGFLYSDGSFMSIGADDGYTFANAINNAGVVAGQTESPSGTVAFKYSNGTMQTYSASNGVPRGTTVANGINDAGQLVGYTSQVGPSTIYLDANGVAMPPVAIRGYYSYATAINNSGAVTASVFADPTSPRHGWVSINGVGTDLGTLGGDWSTASGINDAGQVIGSSNFAPGNNNDHAFLYTGGVMTDLGTLGQAQSEAHGINNAGQVVGSSFSGWWGDGHAFVYADGVMTDLNALIDPATGWTIADASDINNNGQIAAVAVKDGISYAVRLDLASPVPEPAMAGMLLLGAGLLGFRGRRKGAGWSARQQRQDLANGL